MLEVKDIHVHILRTSSHYVHFVDVGLLRIRAFSSYCALLCSPSYIKRNDLDEILLGIYVWQRRRAAALFPDSRRRRHPHAHPITANDKCFDFPPGVKIFFPLVIFSLLELQYFLQMFRLSAYLTFCEAFPSETQMRQPICLHFSSLIHVCCTLHPRCGKTR